MKKYTVYKIINVKTGKCFIGFSELPLNAIRERVLRRYITGDCKLYKSMIEYGMKYFRWEVIRITDEKYVQEVVSNLINLYNSIEDGYNEIVIEKINNRPEWVRRKISESLKGIPKNEKWYESFNATISKREPGLKFPKCSIPLSNETKRKISKVMTGRIVRDVSNMSLAQCGKRRSDAVKRKISERNKLSYMNREVPFVFNNVNYRRVVEMKLVKVGNIQISRDLGISKSGVEKYVRKAKSEGLL